MEKISKNLEYGQEHSPVHYTSKIFLTPLALDNFNNHFLMTVVATMRSKALALADISSDMTLEIEVILILQLTRNRNRENLCENMEKPGKLV